MPTYAKSHQQKQRQQQQQQGSSCTQAATGERYNNAPADLNYEELDEKENVQQHEDRQSSLSSASQTSSCDTETRSSTMMSNADYDHIRNITLMFFLDRLFISSKDGVEVRTLHDLSCLFGTKGFTKEMRQIVGASRNGLKKFLQSYPSLFTVDGDQVYLTQLKQDPNHSSARDYNKEAVEYFREKLTQFGASLVPIKNLFGYRSQASQEVRHVSGKNTKEFKQFLAEHDDVFEMLANEHVVLKSTLEELQSRGETHASLQQTLEPNEESVVMDSYLNKQFAHSVVDCMKRLAEEAARPAKEDNSPEEVDHLKSAPVEEGNKITLEYLHDKIIQECCNNNPAFLKMVKTIENLKVFLRMHPRLFKRYTQNNCNYVSLVTDEERKEMERQAFPNSIDQQQLHSQGQRQKIIPDKEKKGGTNEQQVEEGYLSSGTESLDHNIQPMSLPTLQGGTSFHSTAESSSEQPLSMLPVATESQAFTNNNNNNSKPGDLNEKETNISHNNNHQHKKANHSAPVERRGSKSGSSSSALRATAPPFVPSSHLQNQRSSSNNSKNNNNNSSASLTITSPAGTLINNRTDGAQQQPPTRSSPQVALKRSVSNLSSSDQHKMVDPRVSLRSYLIKASASNTNNALYSPYKLSNGAQHQSAANFNFTRNASQAYSTTATTGISSTGGVFNHLQQQQSGGGEDLRARTVNIVREASNIITRVMNCADAVAFDCKGYNLGFNGQVTLIQFAFLPKSPSATSSNASHLLTSSNVINNNNNYNESKNNILPNGKQKPEVCIFDLITNPELAYCLKPLLESEQIVKIVHDVRNKSNALYNQFGIMLNHIFDTQVANLVIQQQETGKPAYKSRYISMNKLCLIYGDEHLMKYRNSIQSKTRHASSLTTGNSQISNSKLKDVNYWRTRPLTDAMVYESTMDVYCLVGGVYQNLKAKIKPEYEPLFQELNLEGVLARIKPDEIRSVKKERKIDLEVIDLKRKLYSDTVRTIVLSNREIRLLRHIDLTEEVRNKIQQCKKVAKKLERLDMKAAAQNMQPLQSINSQASSDLDTTNHQDQSIDVTSNSVQSSEGSDHTDGDSNASPSIVVGQRNNMMTNEEQLSSSDSNDNDYQVNKTSSSIQGTTNLDSCTDDLGMAELMDSSSMFDELKDKMIESSSLLESLACDDDDDGDDDAQHSNVRAHESYESSNHQLEHSGNHDNCTCHCHDNHKSSGSISGDKTSPSLKSTSSNKSIEDHEDSNVESKAVDMAVQCDLLI